MAPSVVKWPLLPLLSTMRVPPPSEPPPPTLTGAAPTRRVRLRPLTWTTASSPFTLMSFTPRVEAPTVSADGGAPSITSSAWRPPMLPTIDTRGPLSCARAVPGCMKRQASATTAAAAGMAKKARRMRRASVAEVGEAQREIGDLLAQQGDRALQVVALAAAHAHGVALDAGLHLHLAVLDDLLDLLGRVAVDAGLHDDLL